MPSPTISLRKFHIGSNHGFSMVEMLVVVAIVMIMVAVSLPYAVNYRKLYRSEEQALKVIDLIRETSQKALNQRRTFRLEVDATTNTAMIIDENTSTEPDVLVKTIALDDPAILRMDVEPASIGRPNPPNYPTAVFADDEIGHMNGGTNVIGNRVWAAHFRSDGTVVNEGNVPISISLFVFPASSGSSDVPTDNKQVRAITIYGGSGAVRYWRYNGTTYNPN
jgi:prepilin-type N-terminal cleavage/methylation domain-containing protein